MKMFSFNRIWNSPTLMTWLSFATKALSLVIVLPLILNRFSAADISLWYLFSSIIVLLSLADMGFRQTFVRIISYAYGGVDNLATLGKLGETEIRGETTTVNWNLLEDIFSTMKVIYKYLTLLLLILLLAFGTLLLIKPISLVVNQNEAWMAWCVIIVANVIRFYGTIYENYLEGLNKIALVRRIEALMFLGSIITSIGVLVFNSNILYLIIANQIWIIFNVFRNWYLSRFLEDGRARLFRKKDFDWDLFNYIWRPAWRSGVSGIMSSGLTNLSGILYAQIGDPKVVAPFLLSIRLITQIREVSMAPFYSKIPYLSKLRAQNRIQEFINVSRRGMFVSHIVFVVGVICVGVFSKYLLGLIGSKIDFVSSSFWLVLSLAFFVHRYGAMHMQIYLTTNHVISHIADGISGIIFIIVSFLSIEYIGIYSVPLGLICGYLGFYAWYAAKYSYKSLPINFYDFEKKTIVLPLMLLIVYYVLHLFLKKSIST